MTVHVVGAGLSGLAAAVALTQAGVAVRLYEAAAQAGGRCRSYYDRPLGRVIDNGNHLLLSGNRHALHYLRLLGADDRLVGPEGEGFRFIDLTLGREFQLRPNSGPLPWWVFSSERRVPGTHAFDYLGILRLWFAGDEETVARALPHDELYRILWEPLAVSALNTPADEASAAGFRAVLSRTLLRGGAASRPLVARQDLGNSFVEPALAFLTGRGCAPRHGSRLKRLRIERNRIAGLEFEEGETALEPGDHLVLAVPPAVAERIVPALEVPTADEPIVNAHFATSDPPETPVEIVAIVGGAAQWVFRRPGLASVTVSAARGMVDDAPEALAARLWADVARAFPSLGMAVPPYRIIKEKRATIRQSPADEALRPAAETAFGNLWLAGDWTRTGLPATIEGSILSGFRAAGLARRAGAG
ncbi:MAG TPA: hydroxysqualene dehydroxylase HpnE [Alphaproteobacteria bacterium]|nr:hydroxysqualene dehydroxylase HpnE [Alphaproteobacteria bacterium]